MGEEITIIYYTANRISDYFADNIRKELIKVSNGIPIISVSQKPIKFGQNFCIGNIGYSIQNVYKQILFGAKKAKTKYIACAEDDCMYVPEHFELRPPENIISYNLNRWTIDGRGFYYIRRSVGMWTCIAPRQLLIDALEERFEKFSNHSIPIAEPGKHNREKEYGLTPVKIKFVATNHPNLTFNHEKSLGGLRKKRLGRKTKRSLIRTSEVWGNAKELWNKIYAGS